MIIPMRHEYHTVVKMYDTDAAGILYFANQFRFVHDAWESFLNSKGIFIHKLINSSEYMFVIAHAESDYIAPVYLGDELMVLLNVERIGKQSVTFKYDLFRDNELVGKAKTVHVAIDSNTRKAIELPQDLLDTLKC